jgi:D-3-phosphoglycerate dehydrogenase / 2-oxoglutarate reductase
MMNIVVPDDFPLVFAGSEAESQLRTLGNVTVHSERGADEEAELIKRICDAEAVVNLRAYAKFTEPVISACPNLRLISVWGTGIDHIDHAACEARGVTVANTPGVNAHSVAEHTMALMLAFARRIPWNDGLMRTGQWPRSMLTELEGKTLGIVGLGPIGRRVAALAAMFNMRLLAYTSGNDNGRSASVGAHYVELDDLMWRSDIVSLHLRLTPESRGLISRERLALMKPTAFLVNTARGAIVDRTALIDALQRGRIAGAAIDVYHDEPVAPNDPLLSLPNVVLSPHNAGMTHETTVAGLRRTVENVASFLSRA